MMLRALAEWLAALPPLAPYAADGLRTGTAAAKPGCALCDGGTAVGVTDISGRRTEARRYTLYVRAVCLREAEYAALAEACGQTAECIAAADEAGSVMPAEGEWKAGALPALPAPYAADALRCTGLRLREADDSGLATYELALLFTYTGPESPAEKG